MPMSCPACAGELVALASQGHYGSRLVVETCERCRGLWLDATEQVALAYDAALALEGDTDLGTVATHPREDFRACPKCGTALEEMTGGQLPEGLHIDTCRTCRGMWFDRGELLVYKSALEKRRRDSRARELERARKQAGLSPSAGGRGQAAPGGKYGSLGGVINAVAHLA